MKRTLATVCSLFVMSLAPAVSWAKANTDKITVTGAGLAAPLELTSYEVEYFRVFDGLGTFMDGVEQTKGFIIDWLKGTVPTPPDGLEHYQVAFHSKLQKQPGAYQIMYVVSYAYDPATKQGFVYLPGLGEAAFRQYNYRILHGSGFEGNWSYARPEWEDFIRPLIAKEKAADGR